MCGLNRCVKAIYSDIDIIWIMGLNKIIQLYSFYLQLIPNLSTSCKGKKKLCKSINKTFYTAFKVVFQLSLIYWRNYCSNCFVSSSIFFFKSSRSKSAPVLDDSRAANWLSRSASTDEPI